MVHGVRQNGRLSDAMLGVLPFVVTMLATALALIAFASPALWLPGILGGH